MSYHIGPKQKTIRDAMLDGAELRMDDYGHWQLAGMPINRERCGALHLRGFIMQGEKVGEWRKYELTDKGKAAL